MIDGFALTIQLEGQEVDTTSLHYIGSNDNERIYKVKNSSVAKYSGNVPIVCISKNTLKIKGSLPYLITDNNIAPITVKEIRESFNSLSQKLDINLNDAIINNFEFGAVVEIPFSFKEFTHHHVGLYKLDIADFRNKGRYFQNRIIRVKLYDAGANANNKLSIETKQNLAASGHYNEKKNYCKFEIRFKNPFKEFGQNITVKDLSDIDFLGLCSEKLLITYEDIRKTGFQIPGNPKELTTSKLLAITLKELEQRFGIDVEGLIKSQIRTIKVLSHTQKSERRKGIDKAFRGLSINSKNPYNIINQLEAKTSLFLQTA